MWNPFKKKKVDLTKYNKFLESKLVGSSSVTGRAWKCIAEDEEVTTVVGYKDDNGIFFDTKEGALNSNERIKEDKQKKALEKVIIATFPPVPDYGFNTHKELWQHRMAYDFANALHNNPQLLKDYLNENY